MAYRPSAIATAALIEDSRITVTQTETHITIEPNSSISSVGVIFFPGSLVDPTAYTPIARNLAKSGLNTSIIIVPRRAAFGGANDRRTFERAQSILNDNPDIKKWIISGHSRGGEIASRFVTEHIDKTQGLVLLGTSHPRRVDLSDLDLLVTKVLGTKDCVSPVDRSDESRSRLPSTAQFIIIEGANHSQFGYYGFQPMDCFATIGRAQQQKKILAAFDVMATKLSK